MATCFLLKQVQEMTAKKLSKKKYEQRRQRPAAARKARGNVVKGGTAETSSRGVLVTLARKGARRFLTVAIGHEEVDVLEVGRVLEDGDVT